MRQGWRQQAQRIKGRGTAPAQVDTGPLPQPSTQPVGVQRRRRMALIQPCAQQMQACPSCGRHATTRRRLRQAGQLGEQLSGGQIPTQRLHPRLRGSSRTRSTKPNRTAAPSWKSSVFSPVGRAGSAGAFASSPRLSSSLKTVQNHVSNICNKLQVADRAAAVLRARRA